MWRLWVGGWDSNCRGPVGGCGSSWVGFRLLWVGLDHCGWDSDCCEVVGGSGAIGAHGWPWFCSPWAVAGLGLVVVVENGSDLVWFCFFILFGFVGMDLAVVAIDGGGGGGVCCDCGCDYGGSGGRLWVVVEVASFDCGCVVVGYICGWVVVIGYICGCG